VHLDVAARAGRDADPANGATTMTRLPWIGAAALLLSTSSASAQPTWQPAPPPPPEPDEPDEPDEPADAPDPVPAAPEPPPRPPSAEALAPADDDTDRPDGMSIGIGAGYDLPADVLTPNTTSVRFRLASGLTFEPSVSITRQESSTSDNFGDTESGSFELSAAALVRLPRQIRGPVDLVFVGGAGFGLTMFDPDGPDNNTTTTSAALIWGLGLEYWITEHWSVSLTGTNPLARYARSRQEASGNETITTSNAIGVVWSPDVFLMGHLYL
jgi:hypothetical protein